MSSDPVGVPGTDVAAARIRDTVARYLSLPHSRGPNPVLDRLPRSLSFDEFRQLVRQVRPSALLPTLALLSIQGGDTIDSATFRTAPPWAVALIARESILWGNEHRRPQTTTEDLRRIFNAFTQLREPRLHDRDSGMELLAMLSRIAYQQFPLQTSVFEDVSRSHALMIDVGPLAGRLEVLGNDDAWHKILGASLEEVVGATFFLQVAALQNEGWYRHSFLDLPNFDRVFRSWPRDVIEMRIRHLSAITNEFRHAYRSRAHLPKELTAHEYNPLTVTPFICMSAGNFLAPVPGLIMQTVSPGALYYKGIETFGSAFARDLGKLTEQYVGQLLRQVAAAEAVHPEVAYGRKQQLRSIDWFLVLPDLVVLVEVKSARYALRERAAEPGFEERPNELLTRATKQLARSWKALDEQLPEFAHIPNDRPRVNIIVTGEPLYLANSPWMREQREAIALPTLIASLRDMEQLGCLEPAEVQKQLKTIAEDTDRSSWSLDVAIKDAPRARDRNPILERAWNAYDWLS